MKIVNTLVANLEITSQHKMNRGNYAGKVGNRQQQPRNNRQHGGPNKRKWIPNNKFFKGSVGEGQGFAFQRKHKVEHEYNKLRTKERRRKTLQPKSQYTEEYPEHLRHLYMAESAKLKNEDLTNRSKRSLSRMGGQSQSKTDTDDVKDADTEQATSTEATAAATAVVSDITDHGEDAKVNPEAPVAKEAEREDSMAQAKPSHSIPMSNRMKRKLTRKSSYQIAQEEFQEANEKRRKKNEEFLRNKQKKEAAIQKYKNKKKEMFEVLSRKTKKGQPNLNLQMEYLLQKIQGPRK